MLNCFTKVIELVKNYELLQTTSDKIYWYQLKIYHFFVRLYTNSPIKQVITDIKSYFLYQHLCQVPPHWFTKKKSLFVFFNTEPLPFSQKGLFWPTAVQMPYPYFLCDLSPQYTMMSFEWRHLGIILTQQFAHILQHCTLGGGERQRHVFFQP